jgi:hypothetical protein
VSIFRVKYSKSRLPDPDCVHKTLPLERKKERQSEENREGNAKEDLYLTTYNTQQRDIHVSGGIRTHNHSE